MTWTKNTEFDFEQVEGLHCFITLEKRPHYCDRGNFLAKIFVKGALQSRELVQLSPDFKLNIDEQDGWPRYYFDETRAKLEIEAWLVKRKEAVP